MERQIAEGEVIREYVDNNKPVPGPVIMEKKIDKKVEDWHKGVIDG